MICLTSEGFILNFKALSHLFDDDIDLMIDNDDALDAVICVLAAIDFLKQDVIEPDKSQMNLVKKEGWIWVKNLSTSLDLIQLFFQPQ